jgi:hypothetical protein
MPKLILVLLISFVWLSSISGQTNEVTITGEVVDLVSYMTSGVKANTPAGIEIVNAGAKAGNPLGILEEKTGRLYVVTSKQASTGANQSLIPWIGTRVTVKGKVYSKGGARVLVLTTIGKAMQ